MTLGNKAEISKDVSPTINGTASRRPKCNYVPPSCEVTCCAVVLTFRVNMVPLNQQKSFRPAITGHRAGRGSYVIARQDRTGCEAAD